jgi:hypothetical protein
LIEITGTSPVMTSVGASISLEHAVGKGAAVDRISSIAARTHRAEMEDGSAGAE